MVLKSGFPHWIPSGKAPMTSPTKTRVLFVCLGNICRSPLAEGLFRHHLRARDRSEAFDVDSAGTGNWHQGDLADPRMRATAQRHGVELLSRARQVTAQDFDRFDWIVAMDRQNRADLLEIGSPPERTVLMLEFHSDTALDEVPDPYYGGDEGFETVFHLVDTATGALLDRLES